MQINDYTPILPEIIDGLADFDSTLAYLAANILTSTNREAMEFLGSVGFYGFVPDTCFSPVSAVGAFFGTEPKDLLAVLRSYGISRRSLPSEYRSGQLEKLLTDFGADKQYRVFYSSRDEVTIIPFDDPERRYRFTSPNSSVCLSARLILTLTALWLPTESNVVLHGVKERLYETGWYEKAKKQYADAHSTAFPQPTPTPEPIPEVTGFSSCPVTSGELEQIVRRAVADALSEFFDSPHSRDSVA